MKEIQDQVAILGGTGNHDLDQKIITTASDLLGLPQPLPFIHLNVGSFPDGESDLRIYQADELEGKHVVVLQSAQTLDLLNEFLTLGWSARNEHRAKTVTGVLPFLMYRRQDNQGSAEINRLEMVIADMGNNRFDNLIFCDIHSEDKTLEYCKKYGMRGYNTDPSVLYADHIKPFLLDAKNEGVPFFVYSPDVGSIPRAVSLAREIGCDVVFNSKKRRHDGETEFAETINHEDISAQYKDVSVIEAGENLEGSYVCMREDEVSTGGTANRTGWMLRSTYKVRGVFFAGTHPVCAPGWKRTFIDETPFKAVFIGNTIDQGYNNSTGGRIKRVHVHAVIAAQLKQVLSELLEL